MRPLLGHQLHPIHLHDPALYRNLSLSRQPCLDGLLVGHLTGITPSLHEWEAATDWYASAGSGSAKWMTPSIRSVSTGFAFASPFERRGIGIPGASGRLQPVDDLQGVGRRLTRHPPVAQHALHGFGHVQP